MHPPEPIEHPAFNPDPWLAGIFGFDVYRVSAQEALAPSGATLAPRVRLDLVNLSRRRAFAYVKLDVRNVAALGAFQDVGFRGVDTNVTFEKPLAPSRTPTTARHVRLAVPRDEGAVARVARDSFLFTRFHLDPHIPKDTADAVKEQWVRNFFRGKRGDALIVAENEDELVGFALLLDSAADVATVDLIATAGRARRKGLARAMMQFAEVHCAAAQAMRVGTQVANVPSLRLYEGLGYRIVGAQYVLHFHGSPPENE